MTTTPVQRSADSLAAHQDRVGPGRVGTYAVLGAVASALPIPFVGGSDAERVRGALRSDVAGRYGLSVTPDARKILVQTGGIEGPKGFVGSALRFATGRVLARLGPLSVIPPIQSALYTFGLGHLFQRYLENFRDTRATRLDMLEARKLRKAIDAAILGVLRTPARKEVLEYGQPEELRDQVTQAVDGAITLVAGMPSWVVRRLEAAFDEAITRP